MKTKYTPAKFNSRDNALSFAARCHKAHAVVLGDDRRFWVVCLADFNRLVRAGFQPAK